MKYLLLSLLFISTAFGAFLPFGTAPINYYGLSVMGKGELLTSDGAVNGLFSACANGESIEWDSTISNGFKCVIAGGGSTTICQTKVLAADFTNNATLSKAELEFTGLTSGNTYQLHAQVRAFAAAGGGNMAMEIYKNGASVYYAESRIDDPDAYTHRQTFSSRPFVSDGTSIQTKLIAGANVTILLGSATAFTGTHVTLCEVGAMTTGSSW